MPLVASFSTPSPFLEIAAVLTGAGILVVCICVAARLMPCEKNFYAPNLSNTKATKGT